MVQRDERTWWGDFTLSEGQAGRWRVGPSTVWVERLANEWRLHHLQADELEPDAAPEGGLATSLEIPAGASVSRFVFARTGSAIEVRPGLADRPLVVHPEKPVYVMSGEEVTLYLSTPLWLRFLAGEPEKLLIELPSHRPSDTWFGPSTVEGELCYANRTAARVRLEDLAQLSHRAVTPLRLSNRGANHLLVERVKLPIGFLALYRDAGGRFWTQAATLVREEKGDLASLQLSEGVPAEAGAAERVAEPRDRAEQGVALRMFSRLFSS